MGNEVYSVRWGKRQETDTARLQGCICELPACPRHYTTCFTCYFTWSLQKPWEIDKEIVPCHFTLVVIWWVTKSEFKLKSEKLLSLYCVRGKFYLPECSPFPPLCPLQGIKIALNWAGWMFPAFPPSRKGRTHGYSLGCLLVDVIQDDCLTQHSLFPGHVYT